MKRGKKICQTLKDIRLQVARANDIPYEPTECKHKGDCSGTCPKCEEEVRYIEHQLNLRRMMGKAVAVVGVSAGLTALTACNTSIRNILHPDVRGKMPYPAQKDTTAKQQSEPKEEAQSMIVQTDTVSENFIFGEITEQQPSFPGGQQKLIEFIQNNIRYTDEMEETCINGRVIVSFLINEDGSVSNAKIERPIHPLFDNEALRIVSIMPKWRPASQNGKRIKMRYYLPISFKH